MCGKEIACLGSDAASGNAMELAAKLADYIAVRHTSPKTKVPG
jgi:hypothetical protein